MNAASSLKSRFGSLMDWCPKANWTQHWIALSASRDVSWPRSWWVIKHFFTSHWGRDEKSTSNFITPPEKKKLLVPLFYFCSSHFFFYFGYVHRLVAWSVSWQSKNCLARLTYNVSSCICICFCIFFAILDEKLYLFFLTHCSFDPITRQKQMRR